MDPWVIAAAENNARWCDRVCRSHGVPTAMGEELWVALRRSPELYPDAVTCARDLTAEAVLERVDDGPGCSVKDSFADLDLGSRGFVELFQAEWLFREPTDARRPAGLSWTTVETADDLQGWARTAGLAGTIRADLLNDPTVRILAAHGPAGISAGAIASRTGAVVGVSNVFTTNISVDQASMPIVGYEHGEDLQAALANGFTAIGSLRVWLRPSP